MTHRYSCCLALLPAHVCFEALLTSHSTQGSFCVSSQCNLNHMSHLVWCDSASVAIRHASSCLLHCSVPYIIFPLVGKHWRFGQAVNAGQVMLQDKPFVTHPAILLSSDNTLSVYLIFELILVTSLLSACLDINKCWHMACLCSTSAL